jgi:Holliday junction resolvasome RuvABC endonuclease subunit
MNDGILGIDPGPSESAFCLVDRQYRVIAAGKVTLQDILRVLRCAPPSQVAVESIKSYGKRVGAETFETCRAEGRIIQRCADLEIPCFQYGRHKYGKGLLQDTVVNDTLLRRALLERFGVDTMAQLKLKDGKSDLRSAFAIAVFHLDVTSSRRRFTA